MTEVTGEVEVEVNRLVPTYIYGSGGVPRGMWVPRSGRDRGKQL